MAEVLVEYARQCRRICRIKIPGMPDHADFALVERWHLRQVGEFRYGIRRQIDETAHQGGVVIDVIAILHRGQFLIQRVFAGRQHGLVITRQQVEQRFFIVGQRQPVHDFGIQIQAEAVSLFLRQLFRTLCHLVQEGWRHGESHDALAIEFRHFGHQLLFG